MTHEEQNYRCSKCKNYYSKEELDDYICITDIAKAKSKFCQSGRCSAKLVEKSWNIRISVCMGQIYNPELKCSNLNTLKDKRDY